MTSLEFINKEITRLKRIIYVTQNNIALYTENKRDTTELQVKVIVLEDRINSLHQIKTKLEAWEVVKKNIGQNSNDSGYEMNIIFEFDEQNYNKLKKALEVKDD